MRKLKIDKITINIGTGSDQNSLEKATKLIKMITGKAPVKTFSKRRIPTWSIRPGLPIGCKLTIRKDEANKFLKKLLAARENKLSNKQFDNKGNLSFGIPEYIEIPGISYDPVIGIMGLEVCVTIERPGYRIKKRKISKRKIPTKHEVTKQESIEFIKKQYGVEVAG